MDREQISERAAVDQELTPGVAPRRREPHRDLYSRETLVRRVREMMRATPPAIP